MGYDSYITESPTTAWTLPSDSGSFACRLTQTKAETRECAITLCCVHVAFTAETSSQVSRSKGRVFTPLTSMHSYMRYREEPTIACTPRLQEDRCKWDNRLPEPPASLQPSLRA